MFHLTGLLRVRRERPGGRRSCNNLDEVSPAHVTISPKDKDYARSASISDRETAVRVGECPLWVKSRHLHCTGACLLYPRKRHQLRFSACPLWAISGHCDLFDNRVGTAEHRWRNCEAQFLSGFKIDHQLVLGRRLYWKVTRLLAL